MIRKLDVSAQRNNWLYTKYVSMPKDYESAIFFLLFHISIFLENPKNAQNCLKWRENLPERDR